VVGGATGLIGDPSGRSSERSLLSHEDIERNIAGIRKCVDRVVGNVDGIQGRIEVMNNADWVSHIPFVDMMRDVGKHFRVGTMLSRDSVKGRMQGDGMSYTGTSVIVLLPGQGTRY
jgi:tyrosyl-tRNA synthetase